MAGSETIGRGHDSGGPIEYKDTPFASYLFWTAGRSRSRSSNRQSICHLDDGSAHRIAEIEDLVMNGEGTVEKAILALGGVAGMGEKLVAVPYDELTLKEEWNKRSIRTQSGTTADVKWERQLTAVYLEGAAALEGAARVYLYRRTPPRRAVGMGGVFLSGRSFATGGSHST